MLHAAYRSDVRPLVAEARRRNGAALAPLPTYRRIGYRAATVARSAARTPWPAGCDAEPMSVPVVAVDFGASSIRVCRVELGDGPPHVDVVHRVAHVPRRDAGGMLRWEWDRLVAELELGLERALAVGPVASIGIDTWGVDYGLLDAQRRAPRAADLAIATRAHELRTSDVVERIGVRRLYELTGLQLLPFNTIFQLAAHDPAQLAPRRARPDASRAASSPTSPARSSPRRTSAGTTGLLDLAHGRLVG